MTRQELLQILIGKARENGFDFKHWYVSCLRMPWEDHRTAMVVIDSQRRYYALLFHHDFARSFWKDGETITFQVPAQAFERLMPDGTVRTVERKPFMRRTGRTGVWRYHLREMALTEEPLRYMRKFVNVEEELEPAGEVLTIEEETKVPAATRAERTTSKTLELARRSAERRQRQEAELRARQERELSLLLPIPESKSKRSPRLPGSR